MKPYKRHKKTYDPFSNVGIYLGKDKVYEE